MNRWIKFLLAILVGLTLGLVYGWAVSPVEYVDTSPDTLREDYRADYVLMVAEIHHHDHDLDQAARRLAMLGSQPPVQVAAAALDYGLSAGYPPLDIALLQELATDLQAWDPSAPGGQP
ncbi:MAG: hypothetical protein JXB85_17965 [Anaerolineales bacterium]|nr:hypothetical protein [Anaerolineales bacterium]